MIRPDGVIVCDRCGYKTYPQAGTVEDIRAKLASGIGSEGYKWQEIGGAQVCWICIFHAKEAKA